MTTVMVRWARNRSMIWSVPVLRVTNQSGNVTVTGEDRPDIVVDKGPEPTIAAGGAAEIVGRSGPLKIRCPAGTDVVVGTGSGKVRLRGRLGDVRATTESGTITAETVARLDARAKSGSLTVDRCDGDCQLHTESGSVRVGRAGEVEVAAGSGAVDADEVAGGRVWAGSGSVDLGLGGAGELDVHAHSGSVTISVPPGLRPAASLKSSSGSVRCDCAVGTDGEIRVKTGSGSIVVTSR